MDWLDFFILAVLRGLQYLSSPTRDGTLVLAVRAWGLNPWTARNSLL